MGRDGSCGRRTCGGETQLNQGSYGWLAIGTDTVPISINDNSLRDRDLKDGVAGFAHRSITDKTSGAPRPLPLLRATTNHPAGRSGG